MAKPTERRAVVGLLDSEFVTVEPMSVPRTSYDVCGETPLWCPMVCGGGVDNAWCTIHQQHTHTVDDHSLTMVEIMTIDCLGNVVDNMMGDVE